ncbi:MarR family winged helix-turn-helix transcriptional regulator [Corynebacterium choanae]|uniref:Putative HTH-type transcriptional regulator YusO n=1 Tax=Corynebacterium choanae TaxID=1862358 RepID=A0A3G6J3H8_9CORY|nr:MarR family transcriptional regulator [Corynebacterium choanae]AZA12479.1 putative HTH-type transcriptional regulator YusO [Corynebacterium choanae]
MTADPQDLAARIRPALTKLYVTYFRMAEQSDLTGPQITIMTRLQEHGASRISEVARQEGIRMPTASNALHQLEHRGLIERIRDTSDRRGVRVQLTKFGISELARVGEERTRYLAQLFSYWDQDELNEVSELVPLIETLAERYGMEAT